MKLLRLWLLVVSALLVAGLVLSGCGEKIAIPEAQGLFSGSPYAYDDAFEDPNGPLQLTVANKILLVLTQNSLTKRDQNYGLIDSVGGLADSRALCVDQLEQIVFVFEHGSQQVSWYSASNLEVLGSTSVPAVQDANGMATNSVGIDQFPGARTFLYLSDPDSLVVHRYAFYETSGLHPHGILTRSDGDAARFVHEPAGMATDIQDSLLVCDMDTTRNWVIRFVSEPDTTDTTADPDDQDPLRGRAALFDNNSGCVPHPAADFVLGNASECGESGWEGGTSSNPAEFHTPTGLAVDGSGQIFVADTGNNRIQVFNANGDYVMLFGNPDTTPLPVSLGVIDYATGPGNYNYAAYVYVIMKDSNTVLKYISNEQSNYLNIPPDPPPE